MQLGFRIFLFQLQNPMILRQHAHLLNCNRIELCQPLRLRKAVVDKYCITELIAVQARLNSNYGEFAIIRIGIMDLHTFLTSCMKRSLVCSLLEADRQFLQQSRNSVKRRYNPASLDYSVHRLPHSVSCFLISIAGIRFRVEWFFQMCRRCQLFQQNARCNLCDSFPQ